MFHHVFETCISANLSWPSTGSGRPSTMKAVFFETEARILAFAERSMSSGEPGSCEAVERREAVHPSGGTFERAGNRGTV